MTAYSGRMHGMAQTQHGTGDCFGAWPACRSMASSDFLACPCPSAPRCRAHSLSSFTSCLMKLTYVLRSFASSAASMPSFLLGEFCSSSAREIYFMPVRLEEAVLAARRWLSEWLRAKAQPLLAEAATEGAAEFRNGRGEGRGGKEVAARVARDELRNLWACMQKCGGDHFCSNIPSL